MEGGAQSEQELREQAIGRLKKKRDFRGHVFIYLAVNVFLVVIWAITSGGDNFFGRSSRSSAGVSAWRPMRGTYMAASR